MRTYILSIIVALASAAPSFAGATIEIINLDGPGEGFNDPTPVVPVGGNTGTTKGAQRLIAFKHAADIWAATLDSNQVIIVQAAFNPLGTNVLGSAGATFVFSDFGSEGLYPGPEYPATWYGSALADKRAGAELNPGYADINAQFSSDFNFYLGLDNNHGPVNDLVAVLLHEFAHGLNFQNFVNEANGRNLGATAANPDGGQTDIYARHTFDATTGLYWDQMTAAQRAESAVRFGRVVWEGANVSAGVPLVLSFGSPEVRILTPAVIAGPYQFGTAGFGAPISSPGVTAAVVAAEDAVNAAGPATTDGCTAFTNAAFVAGKIAVVERGTCGFNLKAKNAENAGAVGVIIYNNLANVGAAPPGMAADPTVGPVAITAVSVTRADGLAIVGQASNGPSAKISSDLAIRAGADFLGRARLYMPFPVVGGSSGSHYDSNASRNLLMEPAFNGDLTHNVKAPDDLTLELLRDIGWFADADLDGKADELDCHPNSDFSATVVIGGTNTGIANVTFTNGCTISDLIRKIGADAANHGGFASGVAHLTNELRDAGIISGNQTGALQSAAAQAHIP
jgi:hypothetical protein